MLARWRGLPQPLNGRYPDSSEEISQCEDGDKDLVDQTETLSWLSLGLKKAEKETIVCFYLFMLVPGTT